MQKPINYYEEYKAGFIAGFQSVRGKGAAIPAIPAVPAIPGGKTPKQVGFEDGVDHGNDPLIR